MSNHGNKKIDCGDFRKRCYYILSFMSIKKLNQKKK